MLQTAYVILSAVEIEIIYKVSLGMRKFGITSIEEPILGIFSNLNREHL